MCTLFTGNPVRKLYIKMMTLFFYLVMKGSYIVSSEEVSSVSASVASETSPSDIPGAP